MNGDNGNGNCVLEPVDRAKAASYGVDYAILDYDELAWKRLTEKCVDTPAVGDKACWQKKFAILVVEKKDLLIQMVVSRGSRFATDDAGRTRAVKLAGTIVQRM